MRYLIVLVLCLSPLSVYATDQCPQQSYTDAAKEPNYDCPSPQEYVLVPDLPVLPSVSLKKDDKAPREGILLDVNRVFQLGLRIKALRHIRWIETTASDKKIKVEVGYQQSVAKALNRFAEFVCECFTPEGKFVEDPKVYLKNPGKGKKNCKYCPHKGTNCDAVSDIPKEDYD